MSQLEQLYFYDQECLSDRSRFDWSVTLPEGGANRYNSELRVEDLNLECPNLNEIKFIARLFGSDAYIFSDEQSNAYLKKDGQTIKISEASLAVAKVYVEEENEVFVGKFKGGKLPISFLLPNGATLGRQTSIGLHEDTEKLFITQFQRQGEILWVKFKGLNKEGEEHNSWVQFDPSKSGPEAIIVQYKFGKKDSRGLSDSQYSLRKFWQAIKSGNVLTSETDTSISHNYGQLPKSFFLPNGTTLGKPTLIGIREDTEKLFITQFQREGETIWVMFKGIGKEGVEHYSWVQFDPSKSGQEALIVQYNTGQLDHRGLTDSQYNIRKFWHAIKSGNVLTSETDTSISHIYGQLPASHLLPNGTTLGKITAIGFSADTESLYINQFLREGETIWVRFKGLNKEREEHYRWVQFDTSKSGKEAIIVQYNNGEMDYRGLADSQYNLRKFWRGIKKGKVLEAEVDTLISLYHGQLPNSFLLPNGTTLSKPTSISLPKDTEKLFIIQFQLEKETIWVRFKGTDKEGQEHYSWVQFDPYKTGQEAIKVQYSTAKQDSRSLTDSQYNLRKFWQAIKSGNLFTDEIDTSISLNYGKLPESLYLPNGTTLGKPTSIGLPADTKKASIISGVYLGNDEYLIQVRAVDGKNPGKVVSCIVDNEGVRKLNPLPNQIEKGHALDRLIHKFCETNYAGTVSRELYSTGLLTQEVLIPNTSIFREDASIDDRESLEHLIHLKWGNSGRVCFDYLAKNTRLARLLGTALTFYTVEEKYLEGLKAVSSKISGGADLKVAGLLGELGDQTLDGLTIRRHLEIIVAYSDAGKNELLKDYYRDAISGYNGARGEYLEWYKFCDQLLSNDSYYELRSILQLHEKIHSKFYEDEYHLKFARALSYLLSKKDDVEARTKELIEKAVFKYYPELNDYPNAWIVIDKYIDQTLARVREEDDDESDFSESEGSSFLREFNLNKVLQQIAAVPIKTLGQSAALVEVGEAQELTDKQRILKSITDNTVDIIQLIIDSVKDNTKEFQKLELEDKNEIFGRLCTELLKRIKLYYMQHSIPVCDELANSASSNVIDYKKAYKILTSELEAAKNRKIWITRNKDYTASQILQAVNSLKCGIS